MAYCVLSGLPDRYIYMIHRCSQVDPDCNKIDAIKVVRQICKNSENAPEHPLYGLKNAKDFVEMIMSRLKISTSLFIEMGPDDPWRHRAIIGGVLATLGVNYGGITKR